MGADGERTHMKIQKWSGSVSDNAWSIYCGDSSEVIREKVAAESIDCVVTSPPYYSLRDYGVLGQIGLEPTIDDYLSSIDAVFCEVHRTLKKTGLLFLNIGDTYYSAKGLPKGDDKKNKARRFGLRPVDASGLGLPRKSLIGIPWRVALRLQSYGWTLRSAVIWHRPGSVPEPTAHDRPWRSYENVFIFSKSPHYFFNRKALNGEEDIWTISARSRKEDRLHVAPFPDSLVQRCLDVGCPENGVVLDPFVGSGTTMRVALSSGHSAIGIDLSGEYCRHVAASLRKEI